MLSHKFNILGLIGVALASVELTQRVDAGSDHVMLQLPAQQNTMTAEAIESGIEASSGHLARTLVTLQKLATAVVYGSETLTDTQRELLEDISEEMGAMKNATSVGHTEDQGEVDRALEQLTGCDEMTLRIETGGDASTSKEESHSKCRAIQKELKATQTKECAKYADALKQNRPPACYYTYDPDARENLGATHECLRRVTAWAVPLNASLKEKLESCKSADENHTSKAEECDQLQSEYEGAFCSYRQEVTGTCSAYAACRSGSIEMQERVHDSVRVAEEARKSQYVAAEHIVCYLEVFKSNEEEQPNRLQSCVNMTANTSSLDIDYHEPSSEIECATGHVATYPCVSQWVADHYESKDWFSEAPTRACTACDEMTQVPIVPTPAPANTLAPTPTPAPETMAPTPQPATTVAPAPTSTISTTQMPTVPTPAPANTLAPTPTPAPETMAPTPQPATTLAPAPTSTISTTQVPIGPTPAPATMLAPTPTTAPETMAPTPQPATTVAPAPTSTIPTTTLDPTSGLPQSECEMLPLKHFDGNTAIKLPACFQIAGRQSRTMMVWVNGKGFIFFQGADAERQRQSQIWSVRIDDGGRMWFWGAYQDYSAPAGGAWKPDSWNHLAITWNGAELTFYWNGQLLVTKSGLSYSTNGETAMYGGTPVSWPTKFQGDASDLRFFREALSADDIAAYASLPRQE